MTDRYTYDPEQIVFEVLDNDLVVVNLQSGHYYVMEGAALAVWKALSSGVALAAAVAALARRYPTERERVERSVSGFVAQLEAEGLLSPAPVAVPAPAPAAGEIDLGSLPPQFVEPAMYRYTEMEHLIQMDPIRELDEHGWPRRRPEKK